MIRDAARMRRWMLWGAPAMLLAARGRHAGGAGLGLGLWLAAGLLIPASTAYPYPRKRRIRPHRLWLAWSVSRFAAAALHALVLLIAGYREMNAFPAALSLMGAVFFALILGERALTLPLSPRLAWPIGGALAVLAVLL